MIDPDFDPYRDLIDLSEAVANQSNLIVQIIQAQKSLSNENQKLLSLHQKNSTLLMLLEKRINAIELASAQNLKRS